MSLLHVRDLVTHFQMRAGTVRAVNGVSFDITTGETVGLVGESGSGKSVLCLSLLGLIPQPPGKIVDGSARFGEMDLLRCTKRTLRSIRGNRISMVFQDPMTALNPYMRIGDQLIEPLRVHGICGQEEAVSRAVRGLEEAGIPRARDRLRSYPHEFSGGMRQRVMIAMALITQPELLIADEPTTALDVTVQAQILILMKNLQSVHGMSMIFVTHDLGVVAGICDRVLVMYAGRIIEQANVRSLFHATKHPYTRALIASLPSAHGGGEVLKVIPGKPPDLSGDVSGCPFAPRCDFVTSRCRGEDISLDDVGDGHLSACMRVRDGEVYL